MLGIMYGSLWHDSHALNTQEGLQEPNVFSHKATYNHHFEPPVKNFFQLKMHSIFHSKQETGYTFSMDSYSTKKRRSELLIPTSLTSYLVLVKQIQFPYHQTKSIEPVFLQRNLSTQTRCTFRQKRSIQCFETFQLFHFLPFYFMISSYVINV